MPLFSFIDVTTHSQRFLLNLEAFEAKAPGFYDRFRDHQPALRAEFRDDDIFVYDQNRLLCGQGYLAYERANVAAHFANPCRLITPPSKLDAAIERQQKERYQSFLKPQRDDYALTQVYDDAEGALHTGFFVVDLAERLNNSIAILDAPQSNNPYFLTVWGIGMGSFVLELLKTYQPKALILAEDNIDLVYWSLHVTDWSEIFSYISSIGCKLSLTFQPDWTALYDAAVGLIGAECPISLDGTICWFGSESSAMLRAFRRFNSPEISRLTDFTGFTVDEYNMVKNSFRNLSLGTGKVIRAFGYDHDVPVVIVASGPSLNDSIEWLKCNRQHCLLIACGSSLPALYKHGIVADFQLIIERDRYMYEVHQRDLDNGCDYSDVRCLASSTIWPGLAPMFKQVFWFFRSALTPLAIFAADNSEVIYADGPQTVNLGVTFAAMLKAKRAYFVGVDLGAAERSNPRAAGAHGETVRQLSIPTRGNFGRTVYTDPLLVTVRQQVEQVVRVCADTTYINLSNGVRIEGAEPQRLEDVDLSMTDPDAVRQLIAAFDGQMPAYTAARFEDQWYSHDLRQATMQIFGVLKASLGCFEDWSHDLVKWTFDTLNYATLNLRNQTLPRLIRGDVMRWVMAVDNAQRRCSSPEDRKLLLDAAREVFVSNLEKMEQEIYSLFDELELEYDQMRRQAA